MPYADPNEVLTEGRRQLQVITRRFFSQLRQPKWLALSSSLYPETKQHLHSSQISGWGSGTLKDPSPKAFLVLGHLNLALYASLHGSFDYEGVGEVPKLPETMRKIWGELLPMLGPDNEPLGPVELFEVMVGIRDLKLDSTRTVPVEHQAAVSQTLGRYLRVELMRRGVDFMAEMPGLRQQCPSMEPLLMGHTVAGPQLVADLKPLAAAIQQTDTDLWLVAHEAIEAAREAA